MRSIVSLHGLILAGLVCAGGVVAQAADAPSLVIPGRPDVPVMINGRDASYCVVDGDWGLDRPSPGTVVTCGPPVAVLPGAGAGNGFYPYMGKRPRLGRLEVLPAADRRLPPPAESFHRVWGAAPDRAPVSEEVLPNPPPVITAPRAPRPSFE